MKDFFVYVPSDVLNHIIIILPIKSVSYLCLTDKKFNDLIADNAFWREKFLLDYSSPRIKITDWREAYQNYGILFCLVKYGLYGDLGLKIKYGFDSTDIRIKSLSWNTYHMMIIDMHDNIWALGINHCGQLGLGDNKSRDIFTQILPFKVKSVSCGVYHTMIIDLDDNLWSFGGNEKGQLGLKDFEDTNIPHRVFGGKAKSVLCSEDFTVVIDINNEIWSCGDNHYGQLGFDDYENKNELTKVPFEGKVKSIACGDTYTLLIDTNDNLWAFGTMPYKFEDNDFKYSVPRRIFPENKAKHVFADDFDRIIVIDIDDNLWIINTKFVLEQYPHVKIKVIPCSELNINTILIDHMYDRLGLLNGDEIIKVESNDQIILAASKVDTDENGLNFSFLETYPFLMCEHLIKFNERNGNIFLMTHF